MVDAAGDVVAKRAVRRGVAVIAGRARTVRQRLVFRQILRRDRVDAVLRDPVAGEWRARNAVERVVYRRLSRKISGPGGGVGHDTERRIALFSPNSLID